MLISSALSNALQPLWSLFGWIKPDQTAKLAVSTVDLTNQGSTAEASDTSNSTQELEPTKKNSRKKNVGTIIDIRA